MRWMLMQDAATVPDSLQGADPPCPAATPPADAGAAAAAITRTSPTRTRSPARAYQRQGPCALRGLKREIVERDLAGRPTSTRRIAAGVPPAAHADVRALVHRRRGHRAAVRTDLAARLTVIRNGASAPVGSRVDDPPPAHLHHAARGARRAHARPHGLPPPAWRACPQRTPGAPAQRPRALIREHLTSAVTEYPGSPAPVPRPGAVARAAAGADQGAPPPPRQAHSHDHRGGPPLMMLVGQMPRGRALTRAPGSLDLNVSGEHAGHRCVCASEIESRGIELVRALEAHPLKHLGVLVVAWIRDDASQMLVAVDAADVLGRASTRAADAARTASPGSPGVIASRTRSWRQLSPKSYS